MRKSNFTLIALLLLAGCGGGGSDSPTQVSASPEAPAATPAPATSPPPVATVPTPSAPPIASPAPVPVPVSPPAAQPPVAQPPAAQPPAPPPANPTGYVSGQALLTAMQTYGEEGFQGDKGAVSPWIASSPTMPSYRFWMFNMGGNNRAWQNEKRYVSFSSPYDTGSPYAEAAVASMWTGAIQATLEASVNFHTTNRYQAVPLYRDAPFVVEPATQYPRDQSLAIWRNGGYSAALTLQSDGAGFRVCWNATLPEVLRLWCTRHEPSGQFRGIYVIDDSPGMGRHEWGTR